MGVESTSQRSSCRVWVCSARKRCVQMRVLRSPRIVGASRIGIEMSEKRKKYDREFREGVVRIVEETGKPIA